MMGLYSLLFAYLNTYKDQFTTSRMTRSEGAIIEKQTSNNNYTTLRDGEYLVIGPPGKFVLTSDIREWLAVGACTILLGLICVLLSKKSLTRTANNTPN